MSCNRFHTDEDYVQALRAGGRDFDIAADCLYRAYRDRALNQLQRYVGYTSRQRDEIADLLQDAFIIMTQKICDGGYNDGSLLHFWIGIAKGLLRNKVKKDSKLDLVDDNLKFDSAGGESPESILIDAQTSEVIHDLLDKIGSRCKQVMLLWARGYSMREIRDELDFSSEAMARKTKFKCKKKLLEVLENSTIEI